MIFGQNYEKKIFQKKNFFEPKIFSWFTQGLLIGDSGIFSRETRL